MEGTILSWNLENWITVLLMATLGYILVVLVTTVLKNRVGNAAS